MDKNSGGGVQNVYKCKRKDCSYYASNNSPNTCDYGLITGRPRGTTIEACTVYTTGERESRRVGLVLSVKTEHPVEIPHNIAEAAQTIPGLIKHKKGAKEMTNKPVDEDAVMNDIAVRGMSIEDAAEKHKITVDTVKYIKKPRASRTELLTEFHNKTPSPSRAFAGTPIRPPMPSDSQQKKKWYDTIFAELEKGRSDEEVAAEFGIKVKQINLARGQRKRAVSAKTEKQGSTQKQKTKPTQREESPPETQSAPEVAMTLPSVSSVHVDEALLRASDVLNSISSHDSTRLKAAALLMVGEIIHQANDRVEGAV